MHYPESWEPIATSHRRMTETTDLGMCLKICATYQDTLSREWTRTVLNRTAYLVGSESLQCTWWKMDFLSHPLVLTEAVKAAAQADVLIVAVQGTDTVPEELAHWTDEWLVQRREKAGALIALVGLPDRADSPAPVTLEYLRRAATQGGLDFLPQSKPWASEPLALFQQQVAQKACLPPEVLHEYLWQQQESRRIWKIVE